MNRRRFLKNAAGIFVPACFGIVTAKAQQFQFGSQLKLASSGAVQLLSQDFESGVNSPPSGWSNNSGTPKWNQTPAIRGSFSLGITAGTFDTAQSPSFTNLNFVSIFFQVNFGTVSPGSSSTIFSPRDAADAGTLWSIELRQTTNNLQINDAATAHSLTLLSGALASTNYYIWIDYTQGTGANSIITGWSNTSATKPGSPSGSISNANCTSQIDHFRIVEAIGTSTWDYIRVSSGSIGSNPA